VVETEGIVAVGAVAAEGAGEITGTEAEGMTEVAAGTGGATATGTEGMTGVA